MRLLGNVIWTVPICGFLLSFLFYFVGAVFALTGMFADQGRGLMQIGKLLLAPGSRALVFVDQEDDEEEYSYTAFGKFIFYLLFVIISLIKILLLIPWIVAATTLCLTLVGFPTGRRLLREVPTLVNPAGKLCVPLTLAQDYTKLKTDQALEKYLTALQRPKGAPSAAEETAVPDAPTDPAMTAHAGGDHKYARSPEELVADYGRAEPPVRFVLGLALVVALAGTGAWFTLENGLPPLDLPQIDLSGAIATVESVGHDVSDGVRAASAAMSEKVQQAIDDFDRPRPPANEVALPQPEPRQSAAPLLEPPPLPPSAPELTPAPVTPPPAIAKLPLPLPAATATPPSSPPAAAIAKAPAPAPAVIPAALLSKARAAYEGQNYAAAQPILQALASAGNPVAQAKLGEMYQLGNGVHKDDRQAFAWFSKAAEQGNAYAQGRLGDAYHDGRGVARNEAAAAGWWLKAARKGDAWAQYNLGLAFKNGVGVPKDAVQALTWLEEAGDNKIADAYSYLSAIYRKGALVPEDQEKGLTYSREAALIGHENSQYRLALAYRDGVVMPQSDDEAYKWTYISALKGEPEPIRLRDRLAKKFSPEHLAELQQAADRTAADIAARESAVIAARAALSWSDR